MKQLLEFLVKSIVEKPKKVEINENKQEGFTEYSIKVDPEDIKIVIGKNGQTIRAIRTLAKTKAIKQGKRINVKLEEPKE
ncbi:KH domain-containing protein [Patescibacteria group bacterium]|nr:KH domain-containing protein [Patescibacteria group bacterium]